MSKKSYVYISLIFVILSGFIVKDVFGIENYDIFDEILGKTNSMPIETGITMYYNTKNDSKTECNNWLKEMCLYDSNVETQQKIDNYSKNKILTMKTDADIEPTFSTSNNLVVNNVTLNDNQAYCREFQQGPIYGYIEGRKENGNTKIQIYVRKLSNKNEISDLYNKVTNAISKESTNIFSYRYLKCSNKVQNIDNLETKIKQLLLMNGAKNMTEVSINKGYSTALYVNRYTPIKDNGRLIDLNYAVLKGNGENYIIIATPIIDITY